LWISDHTVESLLVSPSPCHLVKYKSAIRNPTSKIQQPMRSSSLYQDGRVFCIEFYQEVFTVAIYSPGAYEKFIGNFLVGKTVGN